MRLTHFAFAFVAMAAVSTPAIAQSPAPDGSANRAAIDRLAFMVGRWKGEAWMQRGPQRVQTVMTETVESRLDGTVLLVEGQGAIPAEGGAPQRTVHHALAIISFDPQSGTYAMRSHIGTGQSGEFALTLIDGGVSWSRNVPGGQVRNTARFANGEWHEIGEFSRDGQAWTQIMEIRLRREP
jgi:hypothetical protein